MCKELEFEEAVALDFSDKDFIPHKEDLSEEVFNFIDFRTLDLVNDDLKISDFDLITSFSAFEHFHDPKEVLKKCHKSLKKGGIYMQNLLHLILLTLHIEKYTLEFPIYRISSKTR